MVVTRSSGKQRALVTGGCGFVGRHLTQQLAASGKYDVAVFDIRQPEAGSGVDGVEYVVGDLRKREDLDKACAGGWCGCSDVCGRSDVGEARG